MSTLRWRCCPRCSIRSSRKNEPKADFGLTASFCGDPERRCCLPETDHDESEGELLFPSHNGITTESSLQDGQVVRRQSRNRRNLASSYGLSQPEARKRATHCRWHASCNHVQGQSHELRWSVITERFKKSHWRFGPYLRSPSICFSPRTGFGRQTWYIYEERQRDERSQGMGDRPRGGSLCPWARCQTNAWEGWTRGLASEPGTQGPSGAVTEDLTNPFQLQRRG